MNDQMKNVDEEYLWDQTGEPDPEIQELERVLGELRYQPRPLVIPASLQMDRRMTPVRSLAPRLAIAATIILAVGAGALWLILGRPGASEATKANKTVDANPGSQQASATVPSDVLREVSNGVLANPPNASDGLAVRDERPKMLRRDRFKQTSIASNRKNDIEEQTPQLDANELKEAEAGKAKLMLALRVASAKLNFALRKAQGSNTGNQIHNQHKIG